MSTPAPSKAQNRRVGTITWCSILPVVHDYAVLTPEKVVVTYRLAGAGGRIFAYLLDVIIVWFLMILVAFLVGFTVGSLDSGLSQLIVGLAFVLGSLLYSTLLEGLWNGQSLGKKAMNLRVRMLDGTPVTFGAALYRNLFRVVDAMPGIPVIGLYMVGFVLMFTSERSQRLGDLAAGTVVVHEPRSVPRFNPAPYKFGQHPFENAVGDLRGMTMEEYYAIKRLCDRFPELGPETQSRSLREFWEPFARRHGIAPVSNVHPVYLMEAVVMRYGRQKGLL